MPGLRGHVPAPGAMGGLLLPQLPEAHASTAAGGQAKGRRAVPAMRGRADRRSSGRRLLGQRCGDKLLRQVPQLLRRTVAQGA